MSTSPSRLAYQDCFELMDLALADSRGIRVKIDNPGTAKKCRQRINQARVIDRKENMLAIADGDPMQGKSQYDYLEIGVKVNKKGEIWLVLERKDTRKYEVESLSQWLEREKEEEEAWKRSEAVKDVLPTPEQHNQLGAVLIRRRI